MEQAAAALHRLDKARSQQLLAAAGDRNTRVTKPLVGIAYTRIDTAGMNQSQQAVSFLTNTYPHGGNSVIIGMNGLLADLVFKENGWDEFEQALMDLGLHLGFRAQRPERERTGKLDVLWGIGNLEYLLFPCKSEAFADAISKQYTDQASGQRELVRRSI